MAGQNSDGLKRTFTVTELGLTAASATTGVWAVTLASNIVSLTKAAAASTSVVNLPVPRSPRGFTQEDFSVSTITVFYAVTTANLTGAPTAILNQITNLGTTAVVSRAAVTQVLSFGGIDAIGTVAGAGAAGSHSAIVTITTPLIIPETDSLVLSLTMNEAATSVLAINGMTVLYA